MATSLTPEQSASVSVSGGARYSKAEWLAYLAAAAEGKTSLGNCELDFPGVKPAHVRHMFRLILKDEAALAKKLAVAKSEEFGIVLKFIG